MKVVIGFDSSEYGDKAIEFFLKRWNPNDEVILVQLYKADCSLETNNNNAAKSCQKIEAQFIDGTFKCKYVTARCKAGAAICRLVREEKASMVIVGEKTCFGLKRLLHKPIYSYVLKYSEVPVLVCSNKTKRLMKRTYGEGNVTWL